MAGHCGDRLYLIGIQEKQLVPGAVKLTFQTNRGQFDALVRAAGREPFGVVMLGDGRGDFAGPAGVYPDLCACLAEHGIASLRLGYRFPGDCVQAGLDTLLALQHLYDEGVQSAVVVGWSFGAVVAVAAGSLARVVRGVASVAITSASGCCTKFLRSKPILVLHGGADTVTSPSASQHLYSESGEHRRMVIYPGAGHCLAEVRDQLLHDLSDWIVATLESAPSQAASRGKASAHHPPRPESV